jgi:ribosomal protein L22
LADAAEDIDTKYPRASAEEIKKLLEKIVSGADSEETTDAEKEAVADLG